MKQMARWLRGREEGLSLLELTVVAAIISILAALTAVAVTGTAGTTRGATRTSDMAEVSKAIDRYAGENRFGQYPTESGCKAGEKVQSSNVCGTTGATSGTDFFTVNESTYGMDINLDGDAADTNLKVVDILWTRGVNARDGDTRTFAPDFIVKPKHADDATTQVEVPDTLTVWVVNESGKSVVLLAEGAY